MYKVNCKICGEQFESEQSGRQLYKLGRHLKLTHKMSVEEYVLQFEYNNTRPTCLCGCGNNVKYRKWKFDKYYKDHKNKTKVPFDVKMKISVGLLKRNKNNPIRHNVSNEQLNEWLELYKTKEYNQIRLSEFVGIDFRTLKKYWITLGLVTKDDLKRYALLHKVVWSNQGENNGQYQNIEKDILVNIYQCLLKSKNTLTLKKIKADFGIKKSQHVLYKRLIENFGKDEINKLLKSGLSSKPENEFYYILIYYFGTKNVKKQFKIKGFRKLYDFCLFDKLIIEWDGEYWHRNKQKEDKEKEKIALDNGYYFYRVLEKKSKDIDTLIKIKEITDEIQIKRN